MNDKKYAEEQIKRSESPIRRVIKQFYIREALKSLKGPTLDVGCGAGQILTCLPSGSEGLESNQYLISHLRSKGLSCRQFFLSDELTSSTLFRDQKFQSLILSHVLEHFPHAMETLRRILQVGSQHASLDRILVIVPTERGYSSDETHQTFVSLSKIKEAGLNKTAGFSLKEKHFFPLNSPRLGKYFAYHELHLLWKRN